MRKILRLVNIYELYAPSNSPKFRMGNSAHGSRSHLLVLFGYIYETGSITRRFRKFRAISIFPGPRSSIWYFQVVNGGRRCFWKCGNRRYIAYPRAKWAGRRTAPFRSRRIRAVSAQCKIRILILGNSVSPAYIPHLDIGDFPAKRTRFIS